MAAAATSGPRQGPSNDAGGHDAPRCSNAGGDGTMWAWHRRFDEAGGHDAGHDVVMAVAMVVATMCEGGSQDTGHESTTLGWLRRGVTMQQ